MCTYSAEVIADFFRATANPDLGDLLSNLKIQKLCYYAAGISSAVREEGAQPLFIDPIEAWQHGPVIPTLYHKFKDSGSGQLPPITGFDFSQIDEADKTMLDDTYNHYGQYSAWKLRDMTHEEAPWVNAYQSVDKTISTDMLRAFFLDEVGNHYIETYREKQKK